MKKRILLSCCLVSLGGALLLNGQGAIADDFSSDDMPIVLPGLDMSDVPVSPSEAEVQRDNQTEPVLEHKRGKVADENDTSKVNAPDPDTVFLPGLEDESLLSETPLEKGSEKESTELQGISDKNNESDDFNASEDANLFEQEAPLPKDGAEWEDWDGWDEIESPIMQGATQEKGSQNASKDAAMEDADAIIDQSRTTEESSLPLLNEYLDMTKRRMRFSGGASSEEDGSEETEQKQPMREQPHSDELDLPGLIELPNASAEERVGDRATRFTKEEGEVQEESGAEDGFSTDRGGLEGQERTSSYEKRLGRLQAAGLIESSWNPDLSFFSPYRASEPAGIDSASFRKEKKSFRLTETPEFTALLERMNLVLEAYSRKRLSRNVNSPFETMMSVWSFGYDAKMDFEIGQGSCVGTLCWNIPIGDLPTLDEMALSQELQGKTRVLRFKTAGNIKDIDNTEGAYGTQTTRLAPSRLFALTGYCQQERSGDLLAALASASIPIESPCAIIPSNDVRSAPYTIGDLVDSESWQCLGEGADMSSQLVGLSHYRMFDCWENQFHQPVSVERIILYELKRNACRGNSDMTDRLFGLTYALLRRMKYMNSETCRDIPLERTYVLLDDYLSRFAAFTLDLQNEDGSWHGDYFLRKGKSVNPENDFVATANIVRWLVIGLPNSRLDDPEIALALEYLTKELESRLASFDPAEQSQKLTKGYAAALFALDSYRQRWGKRSMKQRKEE